MYTLISEAHGQRSYIWPLIYKTHPTLWSSALALFTGSPTTPQTTKRDSFFIASTSMKYVSICLENGKCWTQMKAISHISKLTPFLHSGMAVAVSCFGNGCPQQSLVGGKRKYRNTYWRRASCRLKSKMGMQQDKEPNHKPTTYGADVETEMWVYSNNAIENIWPEELEMYSPQEIPRQI